MVVVAALGCGSDSVPGITIDLSGQPDVFEPDVLEPDAGGIDAFEPPPEMDPVLAKSFQAILDEHVAFAADPGATLAVRTKDGAWWNGASGVADLQKGKVMESQMGFRVGSNTKPLVSTVVLQLVDEGLIGLDDPLSIYVQKYPQWGHVTIRHLLAMQSGIPDFLTNVNLMLDFILDPGTPKDPEVVLSYVEDEPMLYEPGEDGTYSNSNYMLLGMIIEHVTGGAVDQEIRTRLVEPLGLKNTFMDMTGEVRDDVARGYMDLAIVGKLFGVPATIVDLIPEENVYEGTIVDCSYLFHPSLTWSAGALIASAPDMAKFMYGLLNGELLSTETLNEMKDTEDAIILGLPVAYGLGLQVRPTEYGSAYGHGGLNFGYQAGTYFMPDIGLTFSHMHNFLPEQSYSLEYELLDLIVNGIEEPLEPCLPPEGFFHPYQEPYVHARFKGPVNAMGEEAPMPGIGHVVQVTEDVDIPLYGWGSTAGLEKMGLQTRIQVQSVAPAGPGEDDVWRVTVLNMDPGVLDVLDENGVFELDSEDPGAVLLTVTDVKLNPFGNPVKTCFIGVTDIFRPAHISVCDHESFKAEEGAVLKIYASLALETDPEAIKEIMALWGYPVCSCLDQGEWVECS